MTVREQMDEIIRKMGDEAVRDYFEQMALEMKILRGELPMPVMPPLRLPFIYKKEG